MKFKTSSLPKAEPKSQNITGYIDIKLNRNSVSLDVAQHVQHRIKKLNLTN